MLVYHTLELPRCARGSHAGSNKNNPATHFRIHFVQNKIGDIDDWPMYTLEQTALFGGAVTKFGLTRRSAANLRRRKHACWAAVLLFKNLYR